MRLASTLPSRRLARMAAVAALLVLYYVMAVSSASQKSMTFDEMAHLTGGYTYWAFNDYRLHPENGNWPQRLGALPAVVGGSSFPRLDQPAWTTSNVYAMGDQFLYSSGNDAVQTCFCARRRIVGDGPLAGHDMDQRNGGRYHGRFAPDHQQRDPI